MNSRIELLSQLPYRPKSPRVYSPNIGLIGCGGITDYHLQAYVAAGFRITALCDLHLAKAELRQRKFILKPPFTKTIESYSKISR